MTLHYLHLARFFPLVFFSFRFLFGASPVQTPMFGALDDMVGGFFGDEPQSRRVAGRSPDLRSTRSMPGLSPSSFLQR